MIASAERFSVSWNSNLFEKAKQGAIKVPLQFLPLNYKKEITRHVNATRWTVIVEVYLQLSEERDFDNVLSKVFVQTTLLARSFALWITVDNLIKYKIPLNIDLKLN